MNLESMSRVLQTIALFSVLSVAVVTLADASEKKPETATPLMPGVQDAVTRQHAHAAEPNHSVRGNGWYDYASRRERAAASSHVLRRTSATHSNTAMHYRLTSR